MRMKSYLSLAAAVALTMASSVTATRDDWVPGGPSEQPPHKPRKHKAAQRKACKSQKRSRKRKTK